MNRMLRTLLVTAGLLTAGAAAAQVTLYQDDGFQGRSFTTDRNVWNFQRFGFNDRASSVSVRGGAWEVCTDARFEGRCVVLRPGDYPSLGAMGLNDRVSSVREVQNYGRDERSYQPYARDRYSRRDDDRYEYRGDGWRYDRQDRRWERD
jgi:hypothetical protein